MGLLEQCVKLRCSAETATLFFLMAQVPAIDTTSLVRVSTGVAYAHLTHASAQNFVQARYHLVEDPSLAATLREEIEVVLNGNKGEWE